MSVTTADSILKELKNKVYYPVYFLHGDEPYYTDLISSHIEKEILTDEEKEFNLTILYGKETDALTVVSHAKRFPMMSNYQVVLIKEAQDMKNQDALIPYIEKPLMSTILVLCYKNKTPDKRTKLVKLLYEKAAVLESKRLYDNKIPEWINSYLHKKGFRINPRAGMLLSEYIGSNLSRVANELDKLMINLPGKEEITIKHIEDNIGISKDFNIFELQSALGSKNIFKANQIAKYLGENTKSNPLVLTIGSLYNFFSKILLYHSLSDKSRNNAASVLRVNPYFVSDYETAAGNYSLPKTIRIISHLRECDLRSKGVNDSGTKESELLKELIFRILH